MSKITELSKTLQNARNRRKCPKMGNMRKWFNIMSLCRCTCSPCSWILLQNHLFMWKTWKWAENGILDEALTAAYMVATTESLLPPQVGVFWLLVCYYGVLPICADYGLTLGYLIATTESSLAVTRSLSQRILDCWLLLQRPPYMCHRSYILDCYYRGEGRHSTVITVNPIVLKFRRGVRHTLVRVLRYSSEL